MARMAYVVGTARERDRMRDTMEPGVDLVVPMTSVSGRRWESLVVGHGFNERMRDAGPAERAALGEWLRGLKSRVASEARA